MYRQKKPYEKTLKALAEIQQLSMQKNAHYTDTDHVFGLLSIAEWVQGEYMYDSPEGVSVYGQVRVTPRGEDILKKCTMIFNIGDRSLQSNLNE